MLKLIKRIFKPKKILKKEAPALQETPSRKVYVSKNKNISISPQYSKHIVWRGGKLPEIQKELLSTINKLHKKQKTHGLSKKEKTILAESIKRLEAATTTREGTKKINLKN